MVLFQPLDSDWATNEKEYTYTGSNPGITATVYKHGDRTVEIRIAGPFERSFRFVSAIPECGSDPLRVRLTWREGEIRLFLNDKAVETKRKDDPLIEISGKGFLSSTDQGKRAMEQAVAFDISSTRLAELLAANPRHVEKMPSLMIPWAVCESFAMELYLKALFWMDRSTKPAKLHALKSLYDGLLPPTQKRIKDIYEEWLSKQSGPRIDPKTGFSAEFDDVLNACSEAFEDWRYTYETTDNHGNPKTGVKRFEGGPLKGSIQRAALERYPEAWVFEEQSPQPTSPPL